jgi:hypothetical protein
MHAAILTSLVASVVYGLVGLIVRGIINSSRAKPFVGSYAMLDLHGIARGGSVRVEYTCGVTGFLNSTPRLIVFAEHGVGTEPGTEDWSGQIEVQAFSNVALGSYTYRNRFGGALRFQLSDDGREMIEYGFPYSNDHPFIRISRRI